MGVQEQVGVQKELYQTMINVAMRSAILQVGVLEEVTEEAQRIAKLVEQADSRTAARAATEEADALRAGDFYL